MKKYFLFCLTLAIISGSLLTVNEYILYSTLGTSQNWLLDSFFTFLSLMVWAFIVPYLYPQLMRYKHHTGFTLFGILMLTSLILAFLNALLSNLIFHGLLTALGENATWPSGEWSVFINQIFSGLFYRWIEAVMLMALLFVIIRNEFRILIWIENRLPWLSWLKGETIDFMVIKVHGMDQIVQSKDIVMIESDGNYVNIHTIDGKMIHREKITTMEKVLDKNLFHRVHRSFLINRFHLKKITPYKQGEFQLELSNEMTLRSSRSYKETVLLLSQNI